MKAWGSLNWRIKRELAARPTWFSIVHPRDTPRSSCQRAFLPYTTTAVNDTYDDDDDDTTAATATTTIPASARDSVLFSRDHQWRRLLYRAIEDGSIETRMELSRRQQQVKAIGVCSVRENGKRERERKGVQKRWGSEKRTDRKILRAHSHNNTSPSVEIVPYRSEKKTWEKLDIRNMYVKRRSRHRERVSTLDK